MSKQFIGAQYRLANNWFNHVDINNYKDRQMNYLEIGTFYGANVFSVAQSYGLHNDTKLYCIDPWEDYNEYPEYKNEQPTIYIDGNHEPEFVLEDAVLSFRKLKKNGIMIFDDYGWGGPDLTKRGIDGFLCGYHKRIKILGERNTQVFITKLE